jgi:hypothetical protein
MPENKKNNESESSLYSPITVFKVDAMGKKIGQYNLTEKLFEVNEKGVEIKTFDAGLQNDLQIEVISGHSNIDGNQYHYSYSIESLAKKLEESKKELQAETVSARIEFDSDSDSKNPKKVAFSNLVGTITETVSSGDKHACVIIKDAEELNRKFYKSAVAEALLDAENPEEALNKESKLGKKLQELATNKKESFSKQEAEYVVALLKELSKDGLTKEEKETFRTVSSKLAITDSGTYKPTDLGIKVQNIGWNID